MKHSILFALLLSLALLCGCGGKGGIVHCDHCGAEIELEKGSKITEDWIVYCKTCEHNLFGEEGVVAP